MELEELKTLLRKAWSKETTNDPENWSEDNLAWSQCAPTALIVQKLFGGKILRSWVRIKRDRQINEYSHFWNLLPDGREEDLTREQFPENAVLLKDKTRTIDRDVLLSIPNVRERYAKLKIALEELKNQCAPS